jgi:hypothetical protein
VPESQLDGGTSLLGRNLVGGLLSAKIATANFVLGNVTAAVAGSGYVRVRRAAREHREHHFAGVYPFSSDQVRRTESEGGADLCRRRHALLECSLVHEFECVAVRVVKNHGLPFTDIENVPEPVRVLPLFVPLVIHTTSALENLGSSA